MLSTALSLVASIDHNTIHFLNQFADKSPAFDQFVHDAEDSSLLKGGLFMAYFWWSWFRGDGDIAARRRSVLAAIGGGLIAVLIARILQLSLPYHDRPLHAEIGFVLPVGVNPQTLSDWNSMPSDHAALFFALSIAIWFESHVMGYVAMFWTFLICLARVYLGYHYPSDIVGGLILGAAVMVPFHRYARDGRVTNAILRWEEAHRTAFYCIAFLGSYELAILFYDLRQLASDSFHVLKTVMIALN